jgi:hypothetical protein
MQKQDFIELMKCLEHSTWDITPEQLVASYFDKKFSINLRQLKRERDFVRTHVKLELDQASNHSLSSKELIKAMRQPCLEDEDCKMKLRSNASFLVFTTRSINLIEDYVGRAGVPRYVDVRHTAQVVTPL